MPLSRGWNDMNAAFTSYEGIAGAGIAGSGALVLFEPGGSAVAAERRDIRNDAQFEGLRLDLRRELACVHDQAVYLDEPDHGARVDDVNAQELLRAVTHFRQVTDLLGLGAERGLGDTELS